MANRISLLAVEQQLLRLEEQIKHETVVLISQGTTPSVDAADYHAFFEKLAQWGARIDVFTKLLRSAASQLDFQRERAKGLPREWRRREQQSAGDREKRLQGIQHSADRAAAYLIRLYRTALTPTALDLQNGVFQILEDATDSRMAFEALEKISLQQPNAQVRATVSKARQELHVQRPDIPDGLTVLILVMQLLRIWWLERLRQDRDSTNV